MSDNAGPRSEIFTPEGQTLAGGISPFFSVILPTRNRPALLRRALDSVLAQSFRQIEILVVNDGSAEEFTSQYQAMEENCDARVNWYYQPRRANGHGPSYSINTGAQSARGQYLCILDDDDSWVDMDHLQKAYEVITGSAERVDAYYSNQKAYEADGTPIEKPLWLAVLAPRLQPELAGIQGTYAVKAEFLLSCNGFPHLNCTIIHRELYLEIDGMDEGIRYECEVDLYLRTLHGARLIIYNPAFIARHNIPDAMSKRSVSTAVSTLEKRLSQIAVYHKNLARCPAKAIRETCISRLAMLYRTIVKHFVTEKEYAVAASCARISLAFGFSFKWKIYSVYLAFKAVVNNKQK